MNLFPVPAMDMHYIRKGTGKPLLLIHGIGGSRHSWNTIIDALAKERDVIAIDLPGFGDTPPLKGEVSVNTLADAVTEFILQHNLTGIDVVGSSMGARLVLELARRGGIVGAVVSLDPGGFWSRWQKHFVFASLALSIRLLRSIRKSTPRLMNSAAWRTILLAQLSAHPRKLEPAIMTRELQDYVRARSFDELLRNLVYGEEQQGMPKGTSTHPIVIGWGSRDRVCFPGQSQRAMQLFPDAQLHWFKGSGHFPQFDVPGETVKLILKGTS